MSGEVTKIIGKIANGEPAEWIKVRRWDPQDGQYDSYTEMFHALEMHHKKETAFLIQVCKLLAQRALCDCGSVYDQVCGGCDNDE